MMRHVGGLDQIETSRSESDNGDDVVFVTKTVLEPCSHVRDMYET